ncbi:MAG: hypothetical protein HYY62_02615, partial [Deltaproteobacteria bacterium]|nr:hypothetical protein [Deltaproteobacteria bacterium]
MKYQPYLFLIISFLFVQCAPPAANEDQTLAPSSGRSSSTVSQGTTLSTTPLPPAQNQPSSSFNIGGAPSTVGEAITLVCQSPILTEYKQDPTVSSRMSSPELNSADCNSLSATVDILDKGADKV